VLIPADLYFVVRRNPSRLAGLGFDSQAREAELLALLRLLTREPPPDHDFKICPTCKRYGIAKL